MLTIIKQFVNFIFYYFYMEDPRYTPGYDARSPEYEQATEQKEPKKSPAQQIIERNSKLQIQLRKEVENLEIALQGVLDMPNEKQGTGSAMVEQHVAILGVLQDNEMFLESMINRIMNIRQRLVV